MLKCVRFISCINISTLYVISSSDYVCTSWLLFREEEDTVMEWQLDQTAAEHFFRYRISKLASGTTVHFDETMGYVQPRMWQQKPRSFPYPNQTISSASSQHKKWKYNLKKCTFRHIRGLQEQSTNMICGNLRKNSRLYRSIAGC